MPLRLESPESIKSPTSPPNNNHYYCYWQSDVDQEESIQLPYQVSVGQLSCLKRLTLIYQLLILPLFIPHLVFLILVVVFCSNVNDTLSFPPSRIDLIKRR